MKKIISLLTLTSFIFFAPLVLTSEQEPTKLFMGTIQFPENIENNDLCLYYKGQKLTTEWDQHSFSTQYSFLESKYAQELYILICHDITHQTNQDNTVQYLQAASENYKCYKLSATRLHSENNNTIEFSWDISDHELDNKVLPDNTLIFLFNPQLIEGLQLHTWNKKQTMRLIPTIRITNNTTSKELLRTMTIARLQAIDIDTIHKKETAKAKN